MEQKLDKNGLTEEDFLRGYAADRYPKPALTADIVVGGDDMIAVAGNISIDGRQVVDGVETVHSITVASGTDRTCCFMTVSDGSLTLSNNTGRSFRSVRSADSTHPISRVPVSQENRCISTRKRWPQKVC